jgi:hypothetical protein
MLQNTSKHHFGSNGVEWMLHLRYPEIVHLSPKHKFCIFLRAECKRNALKDTQTSFWVQWSRMDVSQLRYLEVVHSGTKHKYYVFLRAEG